MQRPATSTAESAIATIVSLLLLLVVMRTQPDRDALPDDVVDLLRRTSGPGDLVIVVAPQTHFALQRLGDRSAVATDRMPMEIARFPRVVVACPPAAPNRTGDCTIATTMERRARRLYREVIDSWTIEVFQQDRPEYVQHDLTALLAAAEVLVVPTDGSEAYPCPWDGERFNCPGGDWLYVGPHVASFGGQSHRCIWSHPVQGATLRIRYPHIEGGDSVTGWFGLTDYAAGIRDMDRVHVEVRASNSSRRFAVHRQRGRRELDWTMSRPLSGPLEIEISSPNAAVRHLCWDLQVVSKGGRA